MLTLQKKLFVMCPPAPDRPAGVFLNGADEDVIMYLDRVRHGNPLLNNVIDYINPYQYKPSNLPGQYGFKFFRLVFLNCSCNCVYLVIFEKINCLN